MKLARDKPWMVRQLADLDELAPEVGARDDESRVEEPLAVVVVHLVAMPVALVHDRLAVRLARARSLAELDRLGSEPHRSADGLDLLLVGGRVAHRVRLLRIHFRRVRTIEAGDVARELRDGDVHPEADAEVRDPALARNAAGCALALPAARTEAAGDKDSVHALELPRRLREPHVLGVDPLDAYVAAVVDPCVLERLVHGEVGVVQLDVLANERDRDLALALGESIGELLPLAEVEAADRKAEPRADELVEPLGAEDVRHEVDVRDVRTCDHRLAIDVGEERDLLADVVAELLARARHDDVGVDPDAPQLVDGVLRRLRLQLAGGLDVRDERDMQVEHVLRADLAAKLADRLEERERLDVADGAADLRDDDVRRRLLGPAADPLLDRVRDVRDHLHRGTEVLALALAAEDGFPDRAGGVARVA